MASLKRRAWWHFDSNKYGYDYDDNPYPEILSDLKTILNICIESRLLLPKWIDDTPLVYNDVDELIELIKASGRINEAPEFDIKGDTIIYLEENEKVFSNILSIKCYRTFQQSFAVEILSDIFLPMVFDEQTYDFNWNLECYALNYYRVPQVLEKIARVLNWENESLLVKENNERASVQIGYNFFLNPETITQQFKGKPNANFNLNKYLEEMNGSVI